MPQKNTDRLTGRHIVNYRAASILKIELDKTNGKNMQKLDTDKYS